MTAKEFKKRVEGKAYDVDGAFGAQCWDLFAYFCQLMKYPIYNCTTTGYVPDCLLYTSPSPRDRG